MLINKIGIVGNGFVGNAIYENLKNKFDVKVYDVNEQKCLHSLKEVYNTEIVFVCLPTPMTSAEGSECNLSIIDKFFNEVPENTNCLFAIKSTVPIGTTRKILQKRSDLKIVHNPEFLTANNAVEDFKNSERNIIGGFENGELLVNFYKELFPNAKTLLVDTIESETIKYFSNTYLATKVTFFNIMHDLCNKYNMNYENLINGVCSDSRIGFSHSKVPGPDGDKGFGGTCFPKDINSLICTLQQNELNYRIFEEIWNYNKQVRNNWDWSTNQSAVLHKE